MSEFKSGMSEFLLVIGLGEERSGPPEYDRLSPRDLVDYGGKEPGHQVRRRGDARPEQRLVPGPQQRPRERPRLGGHPPPGPLVIPGPPGRQAAGEDFGLREGGANSLTGQRV